MIILVTSVCLCVYLLSYHIPFILDVRLVGAPAEVTQEEGHTEFLHLPSAVLALILIARRILNHQPSLSHVDREVDLCLLDRHHQEKREATRLGNLLSHTEA